MGCNRLQTAPVLHSLKRDEHRITDFILDFFKSFLLTVSIIEDVPLVEFMYLVFTRLPGESYRRPLGSLLLCLCDAFFSANLVC